MCVCVTGKRVAQCELFTSVTCDADDVTWDVICSYSHQELLVHPFVYALRTLRDLRNQLLCVASSRPMGGVPPVSPALDSQMQKGAAVTISSVIPGERPPCLFRSAISWLWPFSSQPCCEVTGLEAGRRIPKHFPL